MVRKDASNDFDFFEFIKFRFMAQDVDCFGSMAILTILILLVQEHELSFHFFESSSKLFINV